METQYTSNKVSELEAATILTIEGDSNPYGTIPLIKQGARVVLCGGRNILVCIEGDLYITTKSAYDRVMAAFAA